MEIAIGKTNHTFDKGIHDKSILWGIYPAFFRNWYKMGGWTHRYNPYTPAQNGVVVGRGRKPACREQNDAFAFGVYLNSGTNATGRGLLHIRQPVLKLYKNRAFASGKPCKLPKRINMQNMLDFIHCGCIMKTNT